MLELTDPENDPFTVINAVKGVACYGEIDLAAGAAADVPSGEMRLYNGYPGPKGWGWRHITSNPRRVDDIKRAGYGTPQAFAYAVGLGWKTLHSGPGPEIRITVALPAKADFQCAIALRWTGDFWSITTMLPFRSVSYPILYEK